MFAIVKSAGSNIGKVRSVYQSYDTAFKNWPVFYKLVAVKGNVKAGDIRPDILK